MQNNRDALGSEFLRRVLTLIFASMVLVGQALPLLGKRPYNLSAQCLAELLPQGSAAGVSLGLGALLIIGAWRRVWQMVICLIFACYEIAIAWRALSYDPYIAGQMLAFAVAAVLVAVAARRLT